MGCHVFIDISHWRIQLGRLLGPDDMGCQDPAYVRLKRLCKMYLGPEVVGVGVQGEGVFRPGVPLGFRLGRLGNLKTVFFFVCFLFFFV